MPSYAISSTNSDCHLTATERAHLIKSTRKLAKVLGVTPVLRVLHPSHDPSNEVIVPFNHSGDFASVPTYTVPHAEWEKRDDQAHNATHLRTPQLQFTSKRPCHDGGLHVLTSSRPLSAQLSPLSASLYAGNTIATPRRISYLPATPISPSCDSDSKRTDRERRKQRKRVSKLSRTLGQAVPPALVAPPGSATSKRNAQKLRIHIPLDTAIDVHRDAAQSLEGTRIEEDEPSSAEYEPLPGIWQASLPRDEEEAEVKHRPRLEVEVAVDVVAIADDNSPVTPSPSSPISSLSFRVKTGTPERLEPNRSHGEGSEHSVRHIFDTRSEYQDSESEHSSDDVHSLPPRSGSRIAQLILGKHNGHYEHEHEVTHRSERRQGWSGEWNASSVQEVIAKLRDLK